MARSRSFVRSLFILILLAGLLGVALSPMFAIVRAEPQAVVNALATPCPQSTVVPTLTPVPTITPTPIVPPTPIPQLGLVINEIDWSGSLACYRDQWIELYNPNPVPIDLTGWTLTGRSGTIGTGGILALSGVIAPTGYFVIAQNSTIFSTNNVTVSFVDPNLFLSFYGEALQLISPSGTLIDTANFSGGLWPAGSSFPDYASMERRGPVPDSASAWITYAGPQTTIKDRDGNFVNGTPGRPNWAFGKTITPSPVPTATKRIKPPTPFPPTPFAHMVINEFLPRPGTDWNNDGVVNDLDEFIEVENLGPISVNLSGWKLDTVLDSSGPFYLPSQTLKPGQRAVYYTSMSNLVLQDSGDTVRLFNPNGVIVDARSYGPVLYPDQSHCRIPDGIGYWRFPCFPTPGNLNALNGSAPAPPPNVLAEPTPCLLADTVPDPFVQAVCNAFGADVSNGAYWDALAQQFEFIVPDAHSKWQTTVQ